MAIGYFVRLDSKSKPEAIASDYMRAWLIHWEELPAAAWLSYSVTTRKLKRVSPRFEEDGQIEYSRTARGDSLFSEALEKAILNARTQIERKAPASLWIGNPGRDGIGSYVLELLYPAGDRVYVYQIRIDPEGINPLMGEFPQAGDTWDGDKEIVLVQRIKGHEAKGEEETIGTARTFSEAKERALWGIAHYVSRELNPISFRVIERGIEPILPLWTPVQFGERVYKVERTGRGPGGYILRIENPDGSREDWAIVLMRLHDHLWEANIFGPGVQRNYRVWVENAWVTLDSLEEADRESQWELSENVQW